MKVEQVKFSMDDYRAMEDCLSTVLEMVNLKLSLFQPCPLCQGPVRRIGLPPHTENCPVPIMRRLLADPHSVDNPLDITGEGV